MCLLLMRSIVLDISRQHLKFTSSHGQFLCLGVRVIFLTTVPFLLKGDGVKSYEKMAHFLRDALPQLFGVSEGALSSSSRH